MTKLYAINLETKEKNQITEYGIRIDSISMWKIKGEILFIYVAGVTEPVTFCLNEARDLITVLKDKGIDFRPRK